MAVIPGLISFFPPVTLIRSSSQVALYITKGDLPVLVISIVPLTLPPTKGMMLFLSGNLPKSSNVPESLATGAFDFSAELTC